MESVTYVEAFIERDGYRWRFFDRDGISIVVIEYQEFDEASRTWKTMRGADIAFTFDDIPHVHNAMNAVRNNAGTA